MTFILVLLITLPSGDVHEYVADGGLQWWECETRGVLEESFNPDINWYCEVGE